jgi:ferredoxin
MKKPVIDHEECIGDGICEQICPEVFELREDGLAYVINESPDDSLQSKIEEAIEECPTSAISWEE